MNQQQNNYISILNSLKEKIRHARYKTASAVNVELLKLYWEIGNTILKQQKAEGWGTKVTNRLAKDLRIEFPEMKGLSERNLIYMQTFASSYPDFLFTQVQLAEIPKNPNNEFTQGQLAELQTTEKQQYLIMQEILAQLTWYHHITLLDKVKDPDIRMFYVQKTAENGWSRDVVVQQIQSELHKRVGTAITNFKQTLPDIHSDLAQQTLKNPYVFDFLTFGEEVKERELEKALMQHLKKFMLELGKGFAYVGNQKNVVVDGDDFFLDLLFYNYNLHCFVIFELKIGDFKPEFAGKLNFYVNTINEQLKGIEDKPTIGVLLCKTPNETVVKYSLKGIDTPIGVADYQFAKALPKQLKGEIPTVEELEAEIDKEYEELKNPSQKRFDALKEKLSQFKNPEIQQTFTTEILFEIIDKSLKPLYKTIIKRMDDFNDWFVDKSYLWQGKKEINDIALLDEDWKDEVFLRNHTELFFSYRLFGFKKAGTEAFNVFSQLNFKMNTYFYGFSLLNYKNHEPFIKKLYHEQLNSSDIDLITETIYNFVMDEIEKRLDFINKGNT